jgi:hypothetical protein
MRSGSGEDKASASFQSTPACGASDGGENPHQRGLPCAIGTEKTQNAGTQLQADVLQPPNISTILFSNRVDEEIHACGASVKQTPDLSECDYELMEQKVSKRAS